MDDRLEVMRNSSVVSTAKAAPAFTGVQLLPPNPKRLAFRLQCSAVGTLSIWLEQFDLNTPLATVINATSPPYIEFNVWDHGGIVTKGIWGYGPTGTVTITEVVEV